MPPKRKVLEDPKVVLFSAKTGKPIKHGVTAYRYHKCRCDVCVNSQYSAHQKWIDSNKDHALAYARERHKKIYDILRTAALMRLGGKCAHCPIEDLRLLQIDHIDGGGKADRKKHGRVDSMYRSIAEFGDQGKYQALCANCHVLKTYNG